MSLAPDGRTSRCACRRVGRWFRCGVFFGRKTSLVQNRHCNAPLSGAMNEVSRGEERCMIGRLPDFPEEVLFWYAFLLPLAAWWNPL